MELAVPPHGTTSSMGWNYQEGGTFLNEERQVLLFFPTVFAVVAAVFLPLLSLIFTYTTYTVLTLHKSLNIKLLQASVSSVSKN
jgi:hypothetical protein